ncbi:Gfo/Idh/MocA family protein [Mesobacterium pallidum]|uniref:Gfo/Idh/MocA family protein n=1 Tax=Mesobacterium pallidum TaxID=2872037 RepID=UPI001EE30E40|nr:Gfo/Idh/MocA family oxidoreductase [Mesobacterium pallidum]
MANHVNWAILGAGKFARDHMGPAIHAAARGRLAAVGTSSAEKGAFFEDMAPGVEICTDYDAVLADPGIDAVYLPLPNHLHVDWSLKAIAAGKHVLCEKPMCMEAAQFDQLIAARDASGLVVGEAYMIVHHPQWAQAKAWIAAGEIGPLVQVDGVFSYNNAEDRGNIRNDASKGGGAIPDIGVYTYGCTRFVTGQEPEEILHADLAWEDGVDVWSHVTARFPSFRYSAVNSMRMAPRQEMTFQGETGRVRVCVPFNANVFGEAQVELHRPGHETLVRRFPGVNHYVLQVEAFNRSVLDGAAWPNPLEFSKGTQAMIDMVYAKAGRPAG